MKSECENNEELLNSNSIRGALGRIELTLLYRLIALAVGVPYNALMSASYYMMYDMYMIEEDLDSIRKGIQLNLSRISDEEEEDEYEEEPKRRNIGRAIGWALWGAAIPILRVLALPIFALYGVVLGAAFAFLKVHNTDSHALDAVLKLPYKSLAKQRDLEYVYKEGNTDYTVARQDYKTFPYYKIWTLFIHQESPHLIPVRPRHAFMLALVVGTLSALMFILLATTGGFGLVSFIAAHTGVNFALTGYAVFNTALAGLTVGVISSLTVSLSTYVLSLLGYQMGHAIKLLRQYATKESITFRRFGEKKESSHSISLLEIPIAFILRSLILIWQGLGIIAATVSLLIFSPIIRVMRLTADITEFADETAHKINRSSNKNDKNAVYHLVNSTLLLLGLIYFTVMLPIAVLRGVVYAFINGYIAGSHGLRMGLSAVALHTDLPRATLDENGHRIKGDIDPADFEQLGIANGQHTLVMTLLFLTVALTTLTILAVIFFPPASQIAVTVLTGVGLSAHSFSLPVLTVASGSATALCTIVVGALAEWALIGVRTISNANISRFSASLMPEKRIKELDVYDSNKVQDDSEEVQHEDTSDCSFDCFSNLLIETISELSPLCRRRFTLLNSNDTDSSNQNSYAKPYGADNALDHGMSQTH